MACLLDLRLSESSVDKGIDATDSQGRTYQIKSRIVSDLSTPTSFDLTDPSFRFDYLVAVFFNPEFDVLGIVRVPYEAIRFSTFPRTEPPPDFVENVVSVFRSHENEIATEVNNKGLKSDDVLAVLGPDLVELGFQVEASKKKVDKLERPVFFGENGIPTLRYEIDGYHPQWKCGLEIEAGRGWMGNAVYRDLVQAAVMVGVEYLCLAVSNVYRYRSSGRPAISRDYASTRQLAEAIYGHSRLRLPYGLILIGY